MIDAAPDVPETKSVVVVMMPDYGISRFVFFRFAKLAPATPRHDVMILSFLLLVYLIRHIPLPAMGWVKWAAQPRRSLNILSRRA